MISFTFLFCVLLLVVLFMWKSLRKSLCVNMWECGENLSTGASGFMFLNSLLCISLVFRRFFRIFSNWFFTPFLATFNLFLRRFYTVST